MHYVMWPWPYYLTRELSSIFLTDVINEYSQIESKSRAGVNSPNRLAKSTASISYPNTPWVASEPTQAGPPNHYCSDTLYASNGSLSALHWQSNTGWLHLFNFDWRSPLPVNEWCVRLCDYSSWVGGSRLPKTFCRVSFKHIIAPLAELMGLLTDGCRFLFWQFYLCDHTHQTSESCNEINI